MSDIDNQIDNFFGELKIDVSEQVEEKEGAKLLDLSAHKNLKEEVEQEEVQVEEPVKPTNPVDYYAQALTRGVQRETILEDLFVPQEQPHSPSMVEPLIKDEPQKTKMTEEDFGNRLRMVEKRISDVALTMGEVKSLSEATVVSGIGQGGDGQTPGSGVVRLDKLDDVDVSDVQPGQGLVWNGNNFTAVDIAGGGSVKFVESVEAGQGIEVTGTFASGEVVVALQAITSDIELTTPQGGGTVDATAIQTFASTRDIAIPILSTQEDANIAFHNILEDFDARLVPIEDGAGAYLPLEGGDLTGPVTLPKDQITNPNHLITDEYADDKYLQLTGGTLTGELSIDAGTYNKAITIKGDAPEGEFNTIFWNSGAVATKYNAFKDDELITKAYADGEIATAVADLEAQITQLDESNLSTTTLSYDFAAGIVPGAFITNDANPNNVTSLGFATHDKSNRLFPELRVGDVITTRAAGLPVQTFKVTDPSNPADIKVSRESTTNDNYVEGETYVVTISHSFEGFATKDYVDTTKISKSGDTMTGKLTLSGAPTSNLHAATKKYVDDKTGTTGDFLPLTGGTMRGTITMGSSSAAGRRIGTSSNSDSLALGRGNNSNILISNTGDIRLNLPLNMMDNKITNVKTADGLTGSEATNVNYVTSKLADLRNEFKDGYVKISGDKVTGRLEVEGAPSEIFRVRTNMSTTNATAFVAFKDANNYNVFRVTANGRVKAGQGASDPFMASSDDDIITKKYFDDNVVQTVRASNPPGMPFKYYDSDYNILYSGQFSLKNDSQVAFHRINADGITWCHLTEDGGDQSTNHGLMTVYDIDSSGRWVIVLRKEFMKTRLGYNYGTSSSTNRVIELKEIYNKHGKRSNLVHNRTYYITVSGLF